MLFQESETVELKEVVVDDIKKEIIAFANCAVREALLNLLVHCDYSFSASALSSIYADRIEFVSIGGLMPGIDLEDIMVGISVCRNQNLANVFYRLHLIEAYGTGMGKIMRAYEGMEEKSSIETLICQKAVCQM